jgi:exopolyphosphatase/pppGpp-phosphohydrolase
MPAMLPSLAAPRATPSRAAPPADRWTSPAGDPHGRAAADTSAAGRTHQSLERWARRHLGSVAHERRVVELATDLFVATRTLHGLGARDLRLLRWAAVVHDVGRAVCDETHPRDGAALILADRSLPLEPAERRQLAFLTRHHRGKGFDAGRDDILAPGDGHRRLLRVLALLRAADGLDNRSLGRKDRPPPHVVFGLARPAGRPARLRVECYLREESGKARRVYARRKKYRLLEAVMGCEVVPTVVNPAGAAHAMA